MSLSGNLLAEEKANVVKQGTVRGRIIDTSKQTLPGATIYIEKLRTGVTSDVNGFYTLPNLTLGTYTVKVSYVGYTPVEMKINVPEGKTLERDVTLNEGMELQEVVVGGAFQGQRRAINSQKNSLGITNVVSADQVGKFPDSNIGDALKRISGINVQYDQGEARFGQVRGTSADLSSVTINGNRVPSAEGDTRNVQLDLIPADMIQTIEVSKVVTSDMDGDAIGGSINLVTKNSPYKRTITATAGSGYNWISDKAQLSLGLTYGDRFFDNRNETATYPDACQQDMNKQLAWIDSVLTAAKEDWVIVVGHHPIYAETPKDDSERRDMQARLDPVLRKHKVDMYVCGHIHNFQYIRVPGSDIDYVVNSSASLARKVKPIEGTQFCSPEPGFSICTADKKELNLRMIDKKGNILYTVTRKK